MERAQLNYVNKAPPKKKRKSRTAFTNHQIFELEKRFLYQKYLSPADRDEIAAHLGLTNAQVAFFKFGYPALPGIFKFPVFSFRYIGTNFRMYSSDFAKANEDLSHSQYQSKNFYQCRYNIFISVDITFLMLAMIHFFTI